MSISKSCQLEYIEFCPGYYEKFPENVLILRPAVCASHHQECTLCAMSQSDSVVFGSLKSFFVSTANTCKRINQRITCSGYFKYLFG